MTTIRSTASRWIPFTPAIYQDCGEVDFDCLMARVHRLFALASTVTTYTAYRFATDPNSFNFGLFLSPILILYLTVELDAKIAERVSLRIKKFKPRSSIIRTVSFELAKPKQEIPSTRSC